MDPVTPAPAAAAPAQSATVTATVDAANRGDFSAFDKADTASRQGKPLTDVAVTPEKKAAVPPVDAKGTTEPPTAERPVSNRQQKANDAIRDAVDRATADLRAENDRLRRQVPAAPRSEAPAAPAAPAEPEWRRYAKMPEAPKLAEFDSVEEHTAAMSFFIAKTMREETAATDAQRTTHDQLQDAQRARGEAFGQRLDAAITADPEFVGKLSEEVRALRPISAIGPGERSGPLNIVAELWIGSDISNEILLHFSQHPEALHKFEQLPPEIARLPRDRQARAHIAWINREFAKLEGRLEGSAASSSAPAADAKPAPSTISAAPPPPPTLSKAGTASDPQAAALARGDFAAFDRVEREKAIRKRNGTA